jgi:hypothetical protein
MPNKIKIEEVMRKLPSFVKIIPETYKGMRYNADFIDIEYNEKFVANVANVVTLQHGCKSRSNALRSKKNQENFKGKFGKENKIDINEVKLKIPYFLEIDESTYTGVRNKARFYDSEYKVWFEAIPANMMKGKGYCKQRQYDNNKIRGVIPLEDAQRRLEEKYGNKYHIISESYESASENCRILRDDGIIINNNLTQLLSNRFEKRKELERWRSKVLVRDDWKCCKCGVDSNCQVHHVEPIRKSPKKMLDVDNGITICKKCHDQYHAIYKNEETVENFHNFILM